MASESSPLARSRLRVLSNNPEHHRGSPSPVKDPFAQGGTDDEFSGYVPSGLGSQEAPQLRQQAASQPQMQQPSSGAAMGGLGSKPLGSIPSINADGGIGGVGNISDSLTNMGIGMDSAKPKRGRRPRPGDSASGGDGIALSSQTAGALPRGGMHGMSTGGGGGGGAGGGEYGLGSFYSAGGGVAVKPLGGLSGGLGGGLGGRPLGSIGGSVGGTGSSAGVGGGGGSLYGTNSLATGSLAQGSSGLGSLGGGLGGGFSAGALGGGASSMHSGMSSGLGGGFGGGLGGGLGGGGMSSSGMSGLGAQGNSRVVPYGSTAQGSYNAPAQPLGSSRFARLAQFGMNNPTGEGSGLGGGGGGFGSRLGGAGAGAMSSGFGRHKF